MKQLIKVLPKHIKKGKPECMGKCPVALALLEQTDYQRVAVDTDEIELVTDENEWFYDNSLKVRSPRSVQRFINRFDTGKPVQPFNFYLDI